MHWLINEYLRLLGIVDIFILSLYWYFILILLLKFFACMHLYWLLYLLNFTFLHIQIIVRLEDNNCKIYGIHT